MYNRPDWRPTSATASSLLLEIHLHHTAKPICRRATVDIHQHVIIIIVMMGRGQAQDQVDTVVATNVGMRAGGELEGGEQLFAHALPAQHHARILASTEGVEAF